MRATLALAVAFAVGWSGVAVAQSPGGVVPKDAGVVAGPTASGARLFVWDDGRDLCGGIVQRRSRSSSCGEPPGGLRDPQISTVDYGPGPGRVWGIVAAEVASVEVVFASGRRLAAQTTDGRRYRGKHAGTYRFFLVEARWPEADYPLYVRLLDAGGALLTAADAEAYDGGRPARPSVVTRGRLGRARWALRAFTKPAFAPLPGDEERVVTEQCLEFDVDGPSGAPQADGAGCDNPDHSRDPFIGLSRTCGPVGLRAYGMVRPGVRVLAVLGDGTRLRPSLVALPRRFGKRLAFAFVLAPHLALRSLATVEDGRRRIEIGGIGPGVADCPDSASDWMFGFDFELPRYGPAPPALQLRDNGVLLCATLGLPDPERRDCGRPPLDEEASWVLSRVTPESTTVAGVVPVHVGSVEVVFHGGETQVVPTTTEGAYTGRYRGLIRVFSLTLAGEHKPRALRFNGIDGRRLASIPAWSVPEFRRAPRQVHRTRSGWRLTAGIVSGGLRPNGRLLCLQLTRGEPSHNPFSCVFADTKLVRVMCKPRGALVYGVVNEGVRRVEVRTTRGSVDATLVSLRALGSSKRAFVAELPAAAGLRVVRVRGDPTRRLRLRLPPANRQCGYSESLSFG